jgi:hypothetical protein
VQVGQPVTSGAVTAGLATALFTLPGNTAPAAYTIVATYNGSAAFASSHNTGTLTVINPLPVTLKIPRSLTVRLKRNQSFILQVGAVATSPSLSRLTFTGVALVGKSLGQVTLSNHGQTLTFTPKKNFHGRARFTFRVTDGFSTTPPVLVTVLVDFGLGQGP